MTDINVDDLGAVDCLIVRVPAKKANFSGEMSLRAEKADRQQRDPGA